MVLISGCHIGDCHYINANHWAEKRVEKIHRKIEELATRPERLTLQRINAAEGVRFSNVMQKMEEIRRTVTAEEIADTILIISARE